MALIIGEGITIKEGISITLEYQVLENVVATNLSATSATVSWTPPVDNGIITSYNITANRQDAPGTVTVNVTAPASSGAVTGLVTGGRYSFTVKVINTTGNGAVGTSAVIYVKPVLGETYQGGIVFRANNTDAWVTPTEGASVYGLWSVCMTFAANLVLNGYSDWILPNTTQLREMIINRSLIGGIGNAEYWTRTIADVITFTYIYTVTSPTLVIDQEEAEFRPFPARAMRVATY